MKKEDVVVEKAFMYKDYFALFKLDPQFSIDTQVLEKNYVALQSNHHPDLFLLKSEKNLALEIIAEVNKAYQTLKSPMKRAEYLLEIKGITVNKNEINSIIEEVFKIQESDSVNVQYQILSSTKAMEDAFYVEDFNEAAKQIVKLKYLMKIQDDRSIT
ncbi:MAG: Fe-S protein assembly co-chaperone HscB [Ehrlichia sp.]